MAYILYARARRRRAIRTSLLGLRFPFRSRDLRYLYLVHQKQRKEARRNCCLRSPLLVRRALGRGVAAIITGRFWSGYAPFRVLRPFRCAAPLHSACVHEPALVPCCPTSPAPIHSTSADHPKSSALRDNAGLITRGQIRELAAAISNASSIRPLALGLPAFRAPPARRFRTSSKTELFDRQTIVRFVRRLLHPFAERLQPPRPFATLHQQAAFNRTFTHPAAAVRAAPHRSRRPPSIEVKNERRSSRCEPLGSTSAGAALEGGQYKSGRRAGRSCDRANTRRAARAGAQGGQRSTDSPRWPAPSQPRDQRTSRRTRRRTPALPSRLRNRNTRTEPQGIAPSRGDSCGPPPPSPPRAECPGNMAGRSARAVPESDTGSCGCRGSDVATPEPLARRQHSAAPERHPTTRRRRAPARGPPFRTARCRVNLDRRQPDLPPDPCSANTVVGQ